MRTQTTLSWEGTREPLFMDELLFWGPNLLSYMSCDEMPTLRLVCKHVSCTVSVTAESYLQSLCVIVGDSVDMLLIWFWFWLEAGFWFWLRFKARFWVWFGGGACCFAACPRPWAPLFGWAPSMLAPMLMLLPSCSLLMCLTTAVALKACCYTHKRNRTALTRRCILTYNASACLLRGPAYPPLALGKVFTDLTADGFMDVLAEGGVSSNPGGKGSHVNYRLCTSCIINLNDCCNSKKRFFQGLIQTARK